jgi:hypothetical protein
MAKIVHAEFGMVNRFRVRDEGGLGLSELGFSEISGIRLKQPVSVTFTRAFTAGDKTLLEWFSSRRAATVYIDLLGHMREDGSTPVIGVLTLANARPDDYQLSRLDASSDRGEILMQELVAEVESITLRPEDVDLYITGKDEIVISARDASPRRETAETR